MFIEGMQQFQNLLLNIVDENTDEEIGYKVKVLQKSQKERSEATDK